jgi:lipoyl(octanoyl) transferase
MATGELRVVHLGTVEYRRALDVQNRLCAERQADAIPDTLLLLEHPMVYTRGRRTGPGELPMGEAWYAAQGIDVVDVDRGGKVTFHGPGQLVGYPIMRTDGVHEFVRRMERALLTALRGEGLEPRTRNDEGRDFTGAWVEDRKIASIGVHVSKGVTTHGFAVNVRNDLQPFGWVVPCGLPEVQMTSVIKETGGDASNARLKRFADAAAAAFAAEHGLTPVDAEADVVWGAGVSAG